MATPSGFFSLPPSISPGENRPGFSTVTEMQLISELFHLTILIKAGAAIIMVVLLSFLAEVVSPRFAGILSGYPLGAAISLFFMGLEIGPGFASKSALYTALGLIATQVFAYGYYRASAAAAGLNSGLRIALACLAGLSGYFAAAALLRFVPVNLFLAILLPIFFIIAFNYLFRSVRNVKIENRVSMNWRVLLFRAVFAAAAIIAITSTAKLVGPGWAGLFSAFPITMLPFVVIIHATYGADRAHAILKNVPTGLYSLVTYSIAVFAFYPVAGIFLGTAMAYGLATVCLVAVQMKKRPTGA